MFKSFLKAAAGIGVGVFIFKALQDMGDAPSEDHTAQACIAKDAKTVPGTLFYINQCNVPINTYSCVKYLADDALDIFSDRNSNNCEGKQVKAGGVILSGNLYDENASWLWNAMTLSQVVTMACPVPKTPTLTSNNQFVCK